ncbi:MAG: Ig-like domain-containing protein [Sandaracinaceae bacterium]
MRTTRILLALLLLTACDPDTPDPDAGTDAGTPPGEDLMRADCDPLVPGFCALPFPSNHWLADDPSTASGHRLALGETTLPRSQARRRMHIDPEPFNVRDGWSVNATILSYLPGATATGLPSHVDLDGSLEDDALTVLINAETGERVPHWSEVDASTDTPEAPRTFMIRPAVVLEHSTRYLVAIRGVVDASGALVEAPSTFAMIRDGGPVTEPAVQARVDNIESTLTALEGHGVAREDLQLAWDFTTSSLESDTGWMVQARDLALAFVGEDGPDFTITEVEEFTPEENANVFRRVQGMMTVPLFLDQPDAGAFINLDENERVVQNGTAEYPFVAVIPHSATGATPARPLQYGHGLLGNRFQADSGFRNEWAQENGYIPFGVDWSGMADDDVPVLVRALANGTAHEFRSIPERLVQGVINSLLAMRMMLRGFGDHPMVMRDGMNVVDGTEGYYTGDSQGGIFGGTYMALSTDVTRGVLGVPGQPYHVLLNRSVDFDPYLIFLRQAFREGVDIQLVIASLQLLWDRAEPGSFTRYIQQDMFPDTPAHTVLLQPAIGDHQVTTLGAHIMARAIGATTLAPQTRPVWGIEESTPPYSGGSVMVEFEYGLNEPVENIPTREGDDPHSQPRRQATALAQVHHFLRNGEFIHTCDGTCDPE